MTTGDHLRLLVVEKSKHDAESLVALLRTGYAIEYSHVETADSLQSHLDRHVPDIILCGSGNSLPPPASILATNEQHGLDIPVIAIAETVSEDAIVAAYTDGISALVSYDAAEHLRLAVDRAVALQHLQRRLASTERALHDTEARCQALAENARDAVACFRGNTLCDANRAYRELFAIKDSAEVGKTRLLDTIRNTHQERFSVFLEKFLAGNSSSRELQLDFCSADGDLFTGIVELSPATLQGEPCSQMVIRSNDMERVLEQRIETLSRQDSLTGLYNRKWFMELLEQCVSERQQDATGAALVYILLDTFKSIREEAGVAGSDMMLCDVAQLIREHAGPTDQVARFGEYAFTLLHRDSTLEESRALGKSLQKSIAAHVSVVEGYSLSTTASIGICAVTAQAGDAQNVLSRADLACEVARTSGGNRVHIHSTAIDKQLARGQARHHDSVVRRTIDENRLSLAFVPIVSLKNDDGRRYEVQLRVVDEAGHAILSREFLAIAEQTGHSGWIDRWMIDAAFKALAECRRNHGDISFYIKLSGSSLGDAELPGWINQKLKQYRLLSDGVVFEVPEHSAVNNLKNCLVFFKAMQKLRCKLALEHYGSSSKAALLDNLPADVVKIDGSLIQNLAISMENQERVREIIELSRRYGKACIAEHVDNANDMAMLWQYGVDFIQGNLAQIPGGESGYELDSGVV